MAKQMTFGVIVGNRGFFPDHLAKTGREEILRIRIKKMDISTDVDIAELARLTEGYSGAELVSVCSEACDLVIRKCRETGLDLLCVTA